MNAQENRYARYVGLEGPLLRAAIPLERDMLRRFTQAVMDADPLYHDEAAAAASRFGGLAAPPLYPVHAIRRAPGTPDPLDALHDDPQEDGTRGGIGLSFGLPPVESPYRRLLNGGSEIRFLRCLRLGETVTARARYVDVREKQGRDGPMLVVEMETRFEAEPGGHPLLVNRQTFIWR
jgi:acyl dehydratase